MMTPGFATDPAEIDRSRRARTWRLAGVELPLLRVAGTVLLSLGVFVSNRFVFAAPLEGWVITTWVLAVYALVSWALLVVFLTREPPVDLTLFVLFGDLPVWTVAIYYSGAEASWLFFILLLRVADQVQTTFRRALAFALAGAGCYAAMLAWIVWIDQRPIATSGAAARLLFLLFAGIYVSLAARTAERRRARLTESLHVSRDLIRRLEEAHSRAEEASAAKSEFVANMSHEMRTPLQSVIGMLDLAMEDEMDAETLRRLETARRSASALMAMIDDVLDFSRIEARKLALEPVYFSLRQFLADTMKSLGVIAAAKQLTLSYVVQAEVEDTVWGDAVRLRQILVNIVGNAVKFTPSGETGLVVSRAGKEIRFSVRDTGVGIPTAARDRIFEPFAQADSSHARSFGGTGLGLSIVVRLLEAMGGRLEVSSEPGSGSVFSFDVPLLTDAVDVAPARQPWESALAGHSIAVVERAEMSRNALQEILRSRGMFVSAYAAAADVPQGRFACAVTCDATVSVQPQVLLISPLDHGPHPIQVTRPVGERELIDAVGRAMGLAQGAEEPRATPAVASKPLRVLLVDDSDVNREVLSEILRRLGHVATVAADGETALEILASRTFDLVFMDVQLPLIDGLEVTRRYRAGGGTTPFIALTAHTSREDREKCLAAGMVSVVTKPVDAVHLASAISTVARRESIADAVGGNAALLTRVRAAFAKQTPEIMNAIRAALSSSDAQALARHAHKLKGSLSYFPGERGSEIAREMEQAAKSGELSRASDMLDDLERAVAELGELLEGVG